MKRTTLKTLFIASLLAASACAPMRPARVVVVPPPVRVEAYGVAPGPEHVWVEGFWRWGGREYAWVPGHWVQPPRGRQAWVPGRWERDRRGWFFREGHWR